MGPTNVIRIAPENLSVAGSFEVKINGKLIFSKIETSGFPFSEDVSSDCWC